MNIYPDLSKVEPENHLLFDLGFSYALLSRARELLRQVLATDEVPKEDPILSVLAIELLEAIEDFEAGRLSNRDQIYESAHKLALAGRL